jgi:hypothetical protein
MSLRRRSFARTAQEHACEIDVSAPMLCLHVPAPCRGSCGMPCEPMGCDAMLCCLQLHQCATTAMLMHRCTH